MLRDVDANHICPTWSAKLSQRWFKHCQRSTNIQPCDSSPASHPWKLSLVFPESDSVRWKSLMCSSCSLFFSVWGQVAQSHFLAAGLDFVISNLLTVCSGWRTQTCGVLTILHLIRFHFMWKNSICLERRVPMRTAFLSRWTSFIHHWLSYQLKLTDWSHE